MSARAGCYEIASVHLALHAARKPLAKVTPKKFPRALAPNIGTSTKRLLEIVRVFADAERDEAEALRRDGAA